MRLLQILRGKRAISFALFIVVFILLSFKISAQCVQTNIAAGKPVVTNISLSYAPGSNITDRDMNTSWAGDVDGIYWAYVDLGQGYPLCTAVVKWYLNASASGIKIQGSNTAANNDWVDIAVASGSDYGQNMADNSYTYHTLDLSSSTTSYRYVRLYIPFSSAWGPKVREFEIYIKQVTVPSVSITSPDNGSNFIQGNAIPINANASEQGGSISKVEFYQGTTKLGEVLTSPYSFVWNNVQAGDYLITAKAIDALNQSTTSSQVEVFVDLPSNAWAVNGNAGTTTTNFLGTTDSKPLVFKTNNLERFRITPDGKIGINTTVVPTGASLAVNGELWARKLKITQSTWADYVFNKNYKLLSLPGLESYIKEHHHLPGMPSAGKVKREGIDVGNNQEVLLKKIEELSLYMIELNKKVDKLSQENKELKKRMNHSK